jgi:beta-lactamase class A
MRPWLGVGPSRRRARLVPVAVLAVVTACEPQPAPDPHAPADDDAQPALAAPVRDTGLEAELRELAEAFDGDVGVAVRHLQRRRAADLNGDRAFPLASIAKLPIAYAALRQGQAGPIDSVTVTAADRAPGETRFAAGTVAHISQLVERSLANSDNTASDVLLRLAGGPAEVTRFVADLGVAGVRVDRSMHQVFSDWRQAGPAAFVRDERDTGTAAGIVALLAALHRGDALDSAEREVILHGLRSAVTGPDRIRAGAPPGASVAHKTGTLGPMTHDVGIITLADGGEVALAVLIRSDAPVPARERLIAAVARAVAARFTPESY